MDRTEIMREALERLKRAVESLAEYAPEGTPISIVGRRPTYFEASPTKNKETYRRWAELGASQIEARAALLFAEKPEQANDGYICPDCARYKNPCMRGPAEGIVDTCDDFAPKPEAIPEDCTEHCAHICIDCPYGYGPKPAPKPEARTCETCNSLYRPANRPATCGRQSNEPCIDYRFWEPDPKSEGRTCDHQDGYYLDGGTGIRGSWYCNKCKVYFATKPAASDGKGETIVPQSAIDYYNDPANVVDLTGGKE